jgi:regulator of sigma E protease
MQVLNMILYTAITLGVLIFIHELGHFLAAKLTGMRVDRFSIGFPPRAFGKKFGETDYCISWVPLGGYVKIAGMVDESMDTEFLNKEPQPWEFRARPMWARMLVLSAGVSMNVLLAVIIFWSIHYMRGTYIQETTEVGYVAEGSAFQKAGLLAGDKILSINGKTVTHWDEIQSLIYIENLGNDIALEVDRQGKEVPLSIPAKSISPATADSQPGIIIAHTVTTIDAVEPNMPAEQLGLKPGDNIIAINNSPVSYPQVVSTIKENAGKTISLSWKRNDEKMSGTTTVTKEGRIGIRLGAKYVGPSRHIDYTLSAAFVEGVKEMGESVRLFSLTVSKIFSGKASVKESFGGPIAIAQMATQSAEIGLLTFLWFMAQISMSLAILNILPIPALDGGHLILLIYEKLFRREIPHKVKIAIQQAGFILLLAFMAFVIYNDISRF